LPLGSQQDDTYRLFNIAFLVSQSDTPMGIHSHRKGPPGTQKISHVLFLRYPIITVPTAITVPAGKSTGSLQVCAVSPLRAAGLLLIMTVALPIMICPLLLGGF